MKHVIAFLLFLGASVSFAADDSIEVIRHDDTASGESSYLVDQPQCQIVWTTRASSYLPGFGIAEKSKCDWSLDKQTPIRRVLLQAVAKQTAGLKGLRHFTWGRLQRGDATDEYAQRLTRIVSQSGAWDKKAGQWIGKAAKRYNTLPELLNKANAFSELISVFAEQHLTLQVSDVERVIVEPMSESSERWNKGDRLPVDCSVVFSVKSAQFLSSS